VLKRRFGSNPRFRVVPQALGDAPGERELYVADKPELTSLAPDWITAVRGSGRFGARVWSATDRVAVTTLDRLIAEHGVPAFCKIDVEGFELQVVSGLSRPIDTISLEFHPEFLDSTFKAIEHLSHLGARSFNYSIAETMSLALPGWVDGEALRDQLRRIPPPLLVGDVYARTAPPGTGNGRGDGGLHSGARRRGAEGGREGGAR
jgi:FkbM family methyltransferase